VCFDNLSKIDDVLSDGLCRIATGAGFGTRTLYSDDAETLFQVCRPQIVNGIPDLARSGDLVDRCITVMLPAREETRTAFESELWAQFVSDLPEMLGFLLDAVSCALRRLDSVHLSARPRLVDFARWVEAAAPALGWKAGEFLQSYLDNRNEVAAALVEGDTLAALISHGVAIWKDPFQGTAGELHALLASLATDDEKKSQEWPKNGQVLSGRLRRLAPALRKTGIGYAVSRANNKRTIKLEQSGKSPSPASPASSSGAGNGLAGDGLAPPPSYGDGLRHPARKSVTDSVTEKPSNLVGGDGGDGGDGDMPASSNRFRRVIFPPVSEIDL
jgi:hypothetical protein